MSAIIFVLTHTNCGYIAALVVAGLSVALGGRIALDQRRKSSPPLTELDYAVLFALALASVLIGFGIIGHNPLSKKLLYCCIGVVTWFVLLPKLYKFLAPPEFPFPAQPIGIIVFWVMYAAWFYGDVLAIPVFVDFYKSGTPALSTVYQVIICGVVSTAGFNYLYWPQLKARRIVAKNNWS